MDRSVPLHFTSLRSFRCLPVDGSKRKGRKVTCSDPLATPHRPSATPSRREVGELEWSREVQWVVALVTALVAARFWAI
jgi:hypothetical protein